MEKNKLLQEVYNLVSEKGCYQDVMSVVNQAWSNYKGKIDEQLSAIQMLSDELIDRKTAKMMLKNEHTEGNLNLEMFPTFRENIIKIANAK